MARSVRLTAVRVPIEPSRLRTAGRQLTEDGSPTLGVLVAHHVRWQEDGHVRQARWASHHPRPDSIVVAGDELRADYAVRLGRRNRAVLWRGDYRNARQLLAAMKRRLGTIPATTFEQHRQDTATRVRILNQVLVEFG